MNHINISITVFIGFLMLSSTLCNRRRKLSRMVSRPDPPLKPFTNTSNVYISYAQFLKSFTSTQGIYNKTATAPSNTTYSTFMDTIVQDGSIMDKDDLSAFMAHAFVLSNGLASKKEEDSLSILDEFSRTYNTRGYLGISGPDAYREASNEIFHDYRLLEDPEMIVQNETVNWKVSLWSWRRAIREAASEQIEKICQYLTFTKCPEIQKVYSIIKKELNYTNSTATQENISK
jgi:hypothetical protein